MEETGRTVPSWSEWRTSTSWSRRLDASSDASPHSTGEVIGISDSRWEATKEPLKRRVIAALNAVPGTVTHVGIVCDPDRKEFVRDVQQYFTSDPHTGGMYPSVLLVDTTRLTRSNSAKSEEIPYSLENNVLTLKITALSPGEMAFYSTTRVRDTGTKLPFETRALQKSIATITPRDALRSTPNVTLVLNRISAGELLGGEEVDVEGKGCDVPFVTCQEAIGQLWQAAVDQLSSSSSLTCFVGVHEFVDGDNKTLFPTGIAVKDVGDAQALGDAVKAGMEGDKKLKALFPCADSCTITVSEVVADISTWHKWSCTAPKKVMKLWGHVINECKGRMALLRDDEKIVIACDVDTLPSVDTFMSKNKDCSFAYLGTVEGGEVVEKRYVLRLEIHGLRGGVVMHSNTESWYESQHLDAFNIWCGHRALADDIAGEVVFGMDVRDGTKEGLTYDNLDAWLKVRRRRRWSPRKYKVHVRCSEPLAILSAANILGVASATEPYPGKCASTVVYIMHEPYRGAPGHLFVPKGWSVDVSCTWRVSRDDPTAMPLPLPSDPVELSSDQLKQWMRCPDDSSTPWRSIGACSRIPRMMWVETARRRIEEAVSGIRQSAAVCLVKPFPGCGATSGLYQLYHILLHCYPSRVHFCCAQRLGDAFMNRLKETLKNGVLQIVLCDEPLVESLVDLGSMARVLIVYTSTSKEQHVDSTHFMVCNPEIVDQSVRNDVKLFFAQLYPESAMAVARHCDEAEEMYLLEVVLTAVSGGARSSWVYVKEVLDGLRGRHDDDALAFIFMLSFFTVFGRDHVAVCPADGSEQLVRCLEPLCVEREDRKMEIWHRRLAWEVVAQTLSDQPVVNTEAFRQQSASMLEAVEACIGTFTDKCRMGDQDLGHLLRSVFILRDAHRDFTLLVEQWSATKKLVIHMKGIADVLLKHFNTKQAKAETIAHLNVMYARLAWKRQGDAAGALKLAITAQQQGKDAGLRDFVFWTALGAIYKSTGNDDKAKACEDVVRGIAEQNSRMDELGGKRKQCTDRSFLDELRRVQEHGDPHWGFGYISST